ncbi:MAG: hypothetical protein WCS03_18740 [Bacteroidota bacterium]
MKHPGTSVYVTEDDLNRARALIRLSPVREVTDTEAIMEMIEILRVLR